MSDREQLVPMSVQAKKTNEKQSNVKLLECRPSIGKDELETIMKLTEIL